MVTVLTCSSFLASAQNKQDLEKKQKKIEKNIQLTQKKLEETKKIKGSNLKDFSKIQSKIIERKAKIDSVQVDVAQLSKRVNNKDLEIARLKNEIFILKNEYNNIMIKAYRAKLLSNPWVQIFSANSINQAFQRWHYLRQIKKTRKVQAEQIAQKQLSLENELSKLANIKTEKQFLLYKEKKQNTLLNQNLTQKNKIIQTLSQDEKTLIANLNKQKKQQNAIQKVIEKAILIEIERKAYEAKIAEEKAMKEKLAEEKRIAAQEASLKNLDEKGGSTDSKKTKTFEVLTKTTKEPTSSKPKNIPSTSTSSEKLSANFQENRGILPWPVSNGQIVRYFGVQSHPDLSHVQINNNGIDIKASQNTYVTAIFEGEVVHIAFIAGYKNIVMINHGKYYTVYSNLDQVFVSKGQKVSKGNALGKVGFNPESNNFEIHFELWNTSKAMNPTTWLKSI